MSLQFTDLPDVSNDHSSASEAVAYAISKLENALSVPRFSYKGVSHGYFELRRDMPYIIHVTSIENTYIIVNRNYKPLGSNKVRVSDWVKYEECTNLHVNLTKKQIASVTSPPHEYGLFGDGNPPWSSRANANAYLARLKSLLSLIQVS